MHDLWTNIVLVAPRIIALALIGSTLLGLAWWACHENEKEPVESYREVVDRTGCGARFEHLGTIYPCSFTPGHTGKHAYLDLEARLWLMERSTHDYI